MSSLRAELNRVRKLAAARQTQPQTLATLRNDPASVLTLAGVRPDPWQSALLRTSPSTREALALCSRQSGKSLTAAGDCLRTALVEPGSLVLILSPTLRQSQELFRKVLTLYRGLNRPVASESVSKTALELANGSRVVALPGDPDGIVGFSSPRLIVIDEAARVRDDLYYAVRPMLAVSRGRLLCVSTPFGCRGWFWSEYVGREPWQRVKVTAGECPRISAAFLERERRALGDRWFRQEWLCSFEADTGAVFTQDDILGAASDEAPFETPVWVAA